MSAEARAKYSRQAHAAFDRLFLDIQKSHKFANSNVVVVVAPVSVLLRLIEF